MDWHFGILVMIVMILILIILILIILILIILVWIIWILIILILILIILILIILILIIFMGKMMKFTIISTETISFGGFLFFGSERVIPVRRVWINGDISK